MSFQGAAEPALPGGQRRPLGGSAEGDAGGFLYQACKALSGKLPSLTAAT